MRYSPGSLTLGSSALGTALRCGLVFGGRAPVDLVKHRISPGLVGWVGENDVQSAHHEGMMALDDIPSSAEQGPEGVIRD
jgi:hypothetical protein